MVVVLRIRNGPLERAEAGVTRAVQGRRHWGGATCRSSGWRWAQAAVEAVLQCTTPELSLEVQLARLSSLSAGGRPSRDCLFSDPARDGKSILKIWNLNEHSGVIAAFNCQGADWCGAGLKNLIQDVLPGTITGAVRGRDVSHLPEVAGDGWNGNVIVYSHVAGEVTVLPKDAALPETLEPREYELFTVVPLKRLLNGASFAPIGLIGMFNSGGAVTGLIDGDDRGIEVKVRAAGTIGAYSSTRPKS